MTNDSRHVLAIKNALNVKRAEEIGLGQWEHKRQRVEEINILVGGCLLTGSIRALGARMNLDELTAIRDALEAQLSDDGKP